MGQKIHSNSGLHPTPQQLNGADSAEIQYNEIKIRIGRLQLFWNFPCNAGRHKLPALKLCLAYLQKATSYQYLHIEAESFNVCLCSYSPVNHRLKFYLDLNLWLEFSLLPLFQAHSQTQAPSAAKQVKSFTADERKTHMTAQQHTATCFTEMTHSSVLNVILSLQRMHSEDVSSSNFSFYTNKRVQLVHHP